MYFRIWKWFPELKRHKHIHFTYSRTDCTHSSDQSDWPLTIMVKGLQGVESDWATVSGHPWNIYVWVGHPAVIHVSAAHPLDIHVWVGHPADIHFRVISFISSGHLCTSWTSTGYSCLSWTFTGYSCLRWASTGHTWLIWTFTGHSCLSWTSNRHYEAFKLRSWSEPCFQIKALPRASTILCTPLILTRFPTWPLWVSSFYWVDELKHKYWCDFKTQIIW